jgi:3-hydroxymyristoyl/3-hydroxydecanoyl-(acyl carrier protein) dehydratase
MTTDTPLGPYAPDHRAFEGHFPGNPLLPGVLLLDAAVHALCETTPAGAVGLRIESVKFTGMVRPGEALSVHGEPGARAAFEVRQDARAVASGRFAPARARDEQP